MNGDFILQTRVELIGKGVDPHRKAGLIVRAGQDADAPYADAVVHGDGLTSLQFRRTKGAITEESRAEHQGRRRPAAGAQGHDLHLLGREVRRAVRHDRSEGPRSRRRRAGRSGAVLAQSRRRRARRLQQRPHHPAGEGRLRAVSRLHRQRARAARRAERPSAGDPPRRTAVRGAELDPGRPRADLQRQRPRRRPRQAVPVRSRDAAAGGHRHRHLQPQQQRSRAVVRRHDARHQRSERRPVGDLHRARPGGGHAEAHHAADAVVPARMVSRRQAAGLHRRPQRRVRHLHHRVGRIGHRAEHDEEQGPGRRSGVLARRQVHLLQLGAAAGRCSCGG